MTTEFANKFKEEVIYFMNVGVIWEKIYDNSSWELSHQPMFKEGIIYAIPGEFEKQRKAYAEGKKIEWWDDIRNLWLCEKPNWSSHAKYRIKQDQVIVIGGKEISEDTIKLALKAYFN